MDTIQDAHESYWRNIIMPSGPITRSWTKKLKQTFQAYIHEWINEEGRLGLNLENLERWWQKVDWRYGQSLSYKSWTLGQLFYKLIIKSPYSSTTYGNRSLRVLTLLQALSITLLITVEFQPQTHEG